MFAYLSINPMQWVNVSTLATMNTLDYGAIISYLCLANAFPCQPFTAPLSY